MRGACDGCLARIDGEPNVMTCLTPARDGMTVDSQNTLGSRDVDLLRVTDWFFPQGVNPHELLAGIPGAQTVMQAFARRVAGLGLLPGAVVKPRSAERRRVDALVIGAGPAGMAVSAALSSKSRAVEVVDDAIHAGGSVRALGPDARAQWAEVEAPFRAAVARGDIRMRSSTVAGGFYGEDILLVGKRGAEVVTVRDVVVAPGAHDGIGLFEGNDVPGVMSARAAGLLLREGIIVGKRVVIALSAQEDDTSFGEPVARALRDASSAEVIVVRSPVQGVRGTGRVRGVVVTEGDGTREIAADALLVDVPRAPAYELCAQAGARLEHEARGFLVRPVEGRIGERVWATGEVVGTPLRPAAILEEASRVARAIAEA